MAATEEGVAINTSMITFKGSTGDTPGYLARPSAEGKYPGVVVIQEWWGLDDHIKSVTERFARQGYVALAPDLYHGEVAKEPDDARRLVMKVQQEQARQDVQGAVDYLNQQAKVEPNGKVGVVGFCFGGGMSMMMAYKGEGVGASVVFYGGIDSDESIKAIKVPVLMLYGAEDPGFPADKVKGWDAKFTEYGKVHQMKIYPGAAHAFFNDTRDSYRKEAAEDGWKLTLDWFRKYLVAGDAGAMQATAAATKSS